MKKMILMPMILFCFLGCGAQHHQISSSLEEYSAQDVSFTLGKISSQDENISNYEQNFISAYLSQFFASKNDACGKKLQVDIDVVNYRNRPAELRFFIGPLSGYDVIDSIVTISDGAKIVYKGNVSATNYTMLGENDWLLHEYVSELESTLRELLIGDRVI